MILPTSQSRHRLWIMAAAAGSLSWGLLFVSLQIGRSTPTTVSKQWLITFLAAEGSLLIWSLLSALLLRRLSCRAWQLVAARLSVASIPLLTSLFLLAAVYGSDEVFHFLSSNPIPKALALWTPLVATLLCQEAVLIWWLPLKCRSRFRGPASAPVMLFAAFAALYIFTAGGHMYSPDEGAMFAVTKSLGDRGTVAIPNDDSAVARGATPFWYSKYGLVPSLLAVPPYWVSKIIGLEPDPPSPAFPIPNGVNPLADLLVDPLASALVCALLYSLALRLGFGPVTSLAVVVAYGLSTTAWVYSKTFFSQPVATMFLLATVYLLLRHDRPTVRNYALAGLSLGLAAGSRVEMLIIAIPLALLLARSIARSAGQALKPLGAFLLTLAVAGGTTLGWYNYAKTGSVLLSGYGKQGGFSGFSHEPLIGLFGTLASPAFSVLLYNPMALVGVLSLPLLARRQRLVAYLFGALVTVGFLFYGSFGDWFAGFTWGNRYLVVLLPYAVLPAAALLERRSFGSVAVVAIATALGFVINFPAVLFDFNNGWLELWQHQATLDLITWDPHFSPIGAHLRLLHDFLFTGAKLDLYLYFKLGFPALLGALLLFVGFLTLAVRSAMEVGSLPASKGGAAYRSQSGSAAVLASDIHDPVRVTPS